MCACINQSYQACVCFAPEGEPAWKSLLIAALPHRSCAPTSSEPHPFCLLRPSSCHPHGVAPSTSG